MLNMLKSLHNMNIQIWAYICYICMRSKRVQLLHPLQRLHELATPWAREWKPTEDDESMNDKSMSDKSMHG